MQTEKPIVVNLPEGQNSLILRQGHAPNELDTLPPIKLDIGGTIDAPVQFLLQRVGDINQHKAHVIVQRDNLAIYLFINEDDAYTSGIVKGRLSYSRIFKQLGINMDKDWEPEALGQFLKLNRSFFVTQEQQRDVVNALKSFDARVNQTIQREKKENGDRNFNFRQAVESNIPESFTLRLPIFSGGEPVDIVVETFATVDGNDVSLQLMSAGANDVIENVRLNKINEVVANIRGIAPELVIIEQ